MLIKILIIIYALVAVLSLILGGSIFDGKFDVGHGGIPLIVIYTSAPATIFFIANLIVALIKFRKRSLPERDPVFLMFYAIVLINIIINLVTSNTLFRYW